MEEHKIAIKPSTLFVMYTLGCNSRCRMCDFWRNQSTQHFDNGLLYNVVSEMYRDNLRALFFTGGECLIFASQLFEIARKLQSDFSGLQLKINTNGLLLSQYAEEIAELFDTVVISLDSVDALTYRTIRGVDGVEIIKHGIDKLRSIKPEIRISIRTLILQENIYGLGDLIEFSLEKKVDKLSFKAEDLNTKFAFGREDNFAIGDPSVEFISNLEQEITKITKKYEQYFISGDPLYEKGDDLRRVLSIYKRDNSFVNACNCATHCCVIYPDATAAPCFFIEPGGDISLGMNTTFQSDYYQETVHNILSGTRHGCMNCVCPVMFA